MKRAKGNRPAAVKPPTPFGRALMWFVVLTCAVAIGLLMWLAREILGQLSSLGDKGGAASTRLLTGLFVVMCFGGFVAAALWAALKKALGREAKE